MFPQEEEKFEEVPQQPLNSQPSPSPETRAPSPIPDQPCLPADLEEESALQQQTVRYPTFFTDV